jgi:hypothetical protein
VGTKTLHGLIAEADLVLHARILSVEERLTSGDDAPKASRPTVEAQVIEVLKGALDAPRVRFAQHGHGVVEFAAGDETLLFLVAIARSRELDALGDAGTHAWVSLQEHEDDYPLEASTRERLLAVAGAYIEADAATSAAARETALRRATLGLLGSGDARLAASAVRDLVLAPDAPLVVAKDRPALEAILEDPTTSMGVRVALLTELERRKIVEGSGLWLRLLSSEVPPPERATAARAAGSSVSGPVRARLIALVADPDAGVAAAAAIAVATPGSRDAVAALARALALGAPKVQMAAIRGLGRVATRDAERALESAASSHPNPDTSRRARAELVKLRALTAPR